MELSLVELRTIARALRVGTRTPVVGDLLARVRAELETVHGVVDRDVTPPDVRDMPVPPKPVGDTWPELKASDGN